MVERARATPRRWRWPPESCTPRSPTMLSRPLGRLRTTSASCASLEHVPHLVVVDLLAVEPEGDVGPDGGVEQRDRLGHVADRSAATAGAPTPTASPSTRISPCSGSNSPEQQVKSDHWWRSATLRGPPREAGMLITLPLIDPAGVRLEARSARGRISVAFDRLAGDYPPRSVAGAAVDCADDGGIGNGARRVGAVTGTDSSTFGGVGGGQRS